MNLVARFLADRRDRLLMRLGCWMVCFSLVIGLMLPQQRAEAVATELTMVAVASVAAAYLGACGLSFVTQGMDKDALVNSCQRLIQEFLDTELGGITIQDWLGGVWDLTVMAGKLLLGKPLSAEMLRFAQWVAQKYGTKVGENVIYSETSSYVTLADGSKFYLCTEHNGKEQRFTQAGTPISPTDFPVTFSTGYSMQIVGEKGNESIYYFDPSGSKVYGHRAYFQNNEDWPMYIAIYDEFGFLNVYFLCSFLSTKSMFASILVDRFDIGAVVDTSESLGFDVAETMQQVLDRLTALEEGQSVALDVGATQFMEIQEILQGILDATLAGNLAATAEIVDEAAVPVDPPAVEIPDVDSLGLPALGAALTSRFPFSIPWDFFRAVKLLAAPAKAPYFEVDFMEPLADEVGGWKGSTTVVLDFAEYEIIGQICRWTSTIGFCLMLASATKRLIWTA